MTERNTMTTINITLTQEQFDETYYAVARRIERCREYRAMADAANRQGSADLYAKEEQTLLDAQRAMRAACRQPLRYETTEDVIPPFMAGHALELD